MCLLLEIALQCASSSVSLFIEKQFREVFIRKKKLRIFTTVWGSHPKILTIYFDTSQLNIDFLQSIFGFSGEKFSFFEQSYEISHLFSRGSNLTTTNVCELVS